VQVKRDGPQTKVRIMAGDQPRVAAVGDKFDTYSRQLQASNWSPSREIAEASRPLTGRVKLEHMLVPKPLRHRVKTGITATVRPLERRRATTLLASNDHLKLHLGCGTNHIDGWLNIDLISTGADLPWDLRYPLPFPDNSVAAVFHEHLLEHLRFPAAVTFLRECHRVLRAGGVLRVAVPDFGRFARDYSSDQSLLRSVRPGRPTALLALTELVFCYDHESAWDEETLVAVLQEVGFRNPKARTFGDSVLSPAPDHWWREDESLYVEGEK
jgi:predicted SAM-dependent methyltransferase